MQSIENVVQEGTPPSSTAIRELLLPVIDGLPDMKLPPGFRLVMREIDRYLATRPSGQADEQTVERSDDVKAVTEMLSGKTVVLIGGVRRRPPAHPVVGAKARSGTAF